MKTMYYFDLDGVLADWEKAYNALEDMPSLKEFNALSKEERNVLKAKFHNYEFFYNLPVIADGLAYINEIMQSKDDVCILSAVGDHNSEDVEMAKREWVKANIGDIPCYFVPKVTMKSQKMLPGYQKHILVDDRQKAIDAWERADGEGILFIN